MNVLAISPHTDDAEMGAGGTVARLLEDGHDVTLLALSTGMQGVGSNWTEFRDAARALKAHPVLWDFECRKFALQAHDIRHQLVQWARGNLADVEQPDLVLIPSSASSHEDHEVITAEARRAFRTCCLIGYETPWSDLRTFNAQLYVPLEARHVAVKLDALGQYRSQMASRHYFEENNVLAHLHDRGMRIKTEYAEAFEVFRWIL